MSTTVTPKEFYQQVVYFRQLMGQRDFMLEKKHQHSVAVNALAFTYATLAPETTSEDVRKCANTLDATLTEFTMRLSMLAMLPPSKPCDVVCDACGQSTPDNDSGICTHCS